MRNKKKYMLKKLGWYAITLVLAVMLNFLLPRLIKGNPVASIMNSLSSGMADTNLMKRMYETYMAQFGLDQPIWKQFAIYVGNLFRGEMGISFSQYPRDVADIIGSAFGWTLLLQLPAILVAWIIAKDVADDPGDENGGKLHTKEELSTASSSRYSSSSTHYLLSDSRSFLSGYSPTPCTSLPPILHIASTCWPIGRIRCS